MTPIVFDGRNLLDPETIGNSDSFITLLDARA